MKLSQIIELSIAEATGRRKPGELRKRIISAIEQGGIKGIMDEFACDLEQAKKYIKLLDYESWADAFGKNSTMTRGTVTRGTEQGIAPNYDADAGGWIPRPGRVQLEEFKALRTLLKIMKFFQVPDQVIVKLIALHKGRKAKKTMHQSDYSEIIEELQNEERITCDITIDDDKKESLQRMGFEIYDDNYRTYVYYPKNEDVVKTILKYSTTAGLNKGRRCVSDILRGLSFGYRPIYVYNYISNGFQQVIDRVLNRDQE